MSIVRSVVRPIVRSVVNPVTDKYFNWSSYWKSRNPTNVSSSFDVDSISGIVTWTDNSDGKGQYEIWSSVNGADKTIVAITVKGAETYTDTTCKQNASVVYSVRGYHGETFTDATALVTPLCFKTDQTTLVQVLINYLYVDTGKTVTIHWGDDTTTDVTGNTANITKDYGEGNEGIYNIWMSGDTNNISRFRHVNQINSHGNLSNWIWPTSLVYIDIQSANTEATKFYGDLSDLEVPVGAYRFYIGYNNFSGSFPNIASGTSPALAYTARGNKFTGFNLATFRKNISTLTLSDQNAIILKADLDEVLKNMADWYEDNAPTLNTAIDLSGSNHGAPTGGTSNVDKVRIEGYFTTAGYTATITVNEEAPFDTPTLVLTWDDCDENVYSQILPVLVDKGVNATFYAVSDDVGGSGQYTWANCLAMVAAGSEVQCHTKTHQNMTTLTEAEQRAEYVAVNAAFVANGLASPNHTAYPFGNNDATSRAIAAEYRQTGRAYDSSASVPGTVQYKSLDKYDIKVAWIDAQLNNVFDLASFKEVLDAAVANNGAVITISHGGSVTPVYAKVPIEDLEEIIDYATAQGMDIITMTELYALL